MIFLKNFVKLFILIFGLSILFKCTKEDPIQTTNITQLTGRWDMTFHKNGVLQDTKEKYFWTFQNDSTVTYNQSEMITTDNISSFRIQNNYYRIVLYNEYIKMSPDYKLALERSNITESDSPYIFIFNGAVLSFILGSTSYYYQTALCCKKLDKTSIILFPPMKNSPMEIHLDKK
jgi:hypothetical protein